MSGLLKAGAADAAVARRLAAGDPLHEEQVERLRHHIATLEAGIDARDNRIAELREEVGQAYLEGEAKGLAQARDDAKSREERLGAAVTAAAARFADTLAGTERLAALIAREALSKLFTRPEDRAELVLDLIRRQVAGLEHAAVLAIEVSGADFRDEDARSLAARVGISKTVDLQVKDGLASGACGIALRLGRIEIGSDQQWGAMSALLDEFVSAGLPR